MRGPYAENFAATASLIKKLAYALQIFVGLSLNLEPAGWNRVVLFSSHSGLRWF